MVQQPRASRHRTAAVAGRNHPATPPARNGRVAHPASAGRAGPSALRAALPHLREVGIVVGAYFAYMYTRALLFTDVEATALANAQDIISLERAAGFFWEPAWQAWAIDRAQAVVVLFNWLYILTFLPVTITSAIVIYLVDRDRYYYYRNVVLLTFVFALLVFIVFPLAPPRMLAEYFVDTIDRFGPSAYSSREAASYYNSFAAMPSLHFTWTVVFGAIFFRYCNRWLKSLGVLYPVMTLLAITITGNHYILDVLVGLMVALASFGTMWLIRHFNGSSPRGSSLGMAAG